MMTLYGFLLFLLASASLASPLAETNFQLVASSMQNDQVTQISIDQMDKFKLYAQYAGASYCDIGKVGGPLFCSGDICPGSATTYATFSGSTTAISAYIAIDSHNKEIVIAVRGSSNIRNWIADLRFLQTACNFGSNCRVHRGFLQAYQDILDDNFHESLDQAIQDYPYYNITVTGHSLGGAVATLIGAYIRDSFKEAYNVDIYTYGSPRVGNVELMNYIHTQANGYEYRLTHYDDVVPRLPPMSYLGYGHTTAEYWLKWGPSDRVNYTADMITQCNGYVNSGCNANGWYPGIKSHLYYLVAISHCGSSRSRLLLGELDSWNGTSIDKDIVERLEMFALMDQEYAAAVGAISDQDP